MPKPLPPLNSLRAFEAAARHLSFTRAADELNVTQAAISHQVKGLEDHLGVCLFRRMPRRLLLTDEGQALLPDLRDGFARLAQAVERVRTGGASGSLTVSTMTTIAMSWLVPRLPRFQEACPDIDIRITTSQKLVDFTREEIDVAIRYGNGGWPGVFAEKMFDDVLTPLCGRAFRDRLRRPEDLRGVPLLRSTEEMEWPAWLAAAGVTGVDLTRGGLVFDSTQIAVRAAADGMGVCMATPSLFADEIAAGRLFQPFPLTVANGKAYWLVAAENGANRPKVRRFRDWVFDEVARARLPAPELRD